MTIASLRRLLSHPDIFSRRNIIIVILLGIGVALFFSIYDGVQEQEDLASFDAPLLAWTISYYNPHLAAIMRVVSDLSSPVALSIFTLVSAGVWMWRKKEIWRPLLLVGAMTVAYILSASIKIFTARVRPTTTDLLEAPAIFSYSFPSGHTLGIAVLLLVLSYFFCANMPTLRRVVPWALITCVSIALVAFSRIYLGYHWLTDVTASVGLAFIILAIVIAVDTYAPWRRRQTTSSKVI